MALSYTMDKIGPMARSAEDCAIVLTAISGHDAGDVASLADGEARFARAAASPRLRVGRVTNAWGNVQPDIAAITERAFSELRSAGAEIVDVALPDGPWEMAAAVTIQVEGGSAFDSFIDSGQLAELTDPGSRVGGYINQTISGADYVRAQRLRSVVQQKMDALFERVDVLAAASLPIAATTMEANLETDLMFSDPLGGIGNFCGLPAISVPSGFTSKNLPAGIQFVGRVLDDAKCVAAAEMFQSRTEWHRKRPRLRGTA